MIRRPPSRDDDGQERFDAGAAGGDAAESAPPRPLVTEVALFNIPGPPIPGANVVDVRSATRRPLPGVPETAAQPKAGALDNAAVDAVMAELPLEDLLGTIEGGSAEDTRRVPRMEAAPAESFAWPSAESDAAARVESAIDAAPMPATAVNQTAEIEGDRPSIVELAGMWLAALQWRAAVTRAWTGAGARASAWRAAMLCAWTSRRAAFQAWRPPAIPRVAIAPYLHRAATIAVSLLMLLVLWRVGSVLFDAASRARSTGASEAQIADRALDSRQLMPLAALASPLDNGLTATGPNGISATASDVSASEARADADGEREALADAAAPEAAITPTRPREPAAEVAEAPRQAAVAPPALRPATEEDDRGSQAPPAPSREADAVAHAALPLPRERGVEDAPPPPAVQPLTSSQRTDLAPARASALNAPPPEPAASAAVPAAVPESASTGRAELDGIMETLEHLQRAYARRDPALAKAVWPTVDTRALSRAFDSLRSQSITFDRCRTRIDRMRGEVECQGTTSYVPLVGSQYARTESRQWTFQMEKSGDAWVITSARAR